MGKEDLMSLSMKVGDVFLDKKNVTMVLIHKSSRHPFISRLVSDEEPYGGFYTFLRLEDIQALEGKHVCLKDVESKAIVFRFSRAVFVSFRRLESIAPFEVKKVEAFRVRQKTPRTITIYE